MDAFSLTPTKRGHAVYERTVHGGDIPRSKLAEAQLVSTIIGVSNKYEVTEGGRRRDSVGSFVVRSDCAFTAKADGALNVLVNLFKCSLKLSDGEGSSSARVVIFFPP